MNSISANLNLMIKACEKASKVIIRDFGELENLQVSKKGPKDFVTNTDKRVEKILIEELSKTKKGYSFITEESGKILNKNKNVFWIIDPIDGTTNFLHGIPHFAISVALQKEDEIISGLIYDPIKNEIFYAEKNNGSFINNNRVRVSNKSNLEECLFASNNDGIKSVHPRLNLRNTGCAALDLAYVGCGRLDGYFHNKINLWDIAAGKIIIEEAGGKVNNIKDFKIRQIDIRAGNPNIYDKMLQKSRQVLIVFKIIFAIRLAMKKNIHPNYHKIKVEMTDGSQFETKSTWGSENEILKLEIDPKSHSAWTGGKQKILDKGRISKFNKKFQNFRSEKKINVKSTINANGNSCMACRKYFLNL